MRQKRKMGTAGWIFGAVVVITTLIVVLTKIDQLKHKYLLKIVLVLVAFLLFTMGYVYWETRPDLTTYSGFIKFGDSYSLWLKSMFNNLGGITTYAVKQNWGLNATG